MNRTGKWTPCKFAVKPPDKDGHEIEVSGRERWALECLIAAGANGCTPITKPAPRWSAYVHDLRHSHRVPIETVHEAHQGDFPGTHARYVLRCDVSPVGGV